MTEITPQLFQHGFDWLYFLPEDFDAIVAVGHSSTLQRRAIRTLTIGREESRREFELPEHVLEMETFHISLIECSMNPKYAQEHPRHVMRFSSKEEIIAAIELLHKLIEQGKKVFCHCDAGVCRSVGICAAYLVRSGKFETIEEAYKSSSGWDWDKTGSNPFEVTLKEVCDSKYWTTFDRYRDILNTPMTKAGVLV